MQRSNNGPALPALVKGSGRVASESYMEFFDRQSLGCASNYRSVSRRFFRWAEEQQLSLQGVRPEHVRRFHRELLEESGPNVQYASFSVLRRLFQHLHEHGDLALNPAEGVEVRHCPRFEVVRRAFCEQWGCPDYDEVTLAAMVMLAPVCIGTFSPKAIRAWSQLPLPTVESIVARLYEKEIWFRDDSIRCEWLDPECESRELAILFDALVVVGQWERDDQLGYSLPKEKYEQMQVEKVAQEGRVKVTRKVREERREIVTVREASETVEALAGVEE